MYGLIHKALESMVRKQYGETTWEEIATTVHAHPTLSEAIMEAALDAYGQGIHQ